MVEMLETAAILRGATRRSLVLFDEVGRGTSTYDGLAIARAVVEYLHARPERAAKTLFATHYHEMTQLAATLPRVRNFSVAVTEQDGQVVFLHRIVAGGADRSYGIHVAELAGMPAPVIERAREVLAALEAARRDGAGGAASAGAAAAAAGAQTPSAVEAELAALDLDGADAAAGADEALRAQGEGRLTPRRRERRGQEETASPSDLSSGAPPRSQRGRKQGQPAYGRLRRRHTDDRPQCERERRRHGADQELAAAAEEDVAAGEDRKRGADAEQGQRRRGRC